MHRTRKNNRLLHTRLCNTRRLILERLETRLCLASYVTVDLIPLAGHDYSGALGVSDSDLVVGWSRQLAGTERAAVAWQIGQNGDASVHALPGIDSEPSLLAAEVNNQGMIAGEVLLDTGVHAAVWTGAFGSHVAHDLGTLGAEFVYSTASSVSEPDGNGHVWVVGNSRTDPMPPQPIVHRGVLWQVDSQGNVLSTTDLEPTGSDVWANDVQMIGNSVFIAGESSAQAVVWEADLTGTVVTRNELGTASFEAIQAHALNADGDVAGWGREPGAIRDGFLHENGVFTDLGSLGNNGSRAWGINDNDVVVGEYGHVTSKGGGTNESHAFVWENGSMQKLSDQVSGRDFTFLYSAFDINTDGDIVGNGRLGKKAGSEEHGYMAVPLGGNQQPLANDDSYVTELDTTLDVSAPGVLNNDTDADSDPLSAALMTGPGNAQSFELNADGSFAYTPADGFSGTDSFTYVASDGISDSNVATVTIKVGQTSPPMHVGDLDGTVKNIGPTWKALVTITVLDDAGSPVANATVNGTWSGNIGSVSISTDTNGQATASSPKVSDSKDSVVFTVDGIVHGSFVYDSTANADPDGDSNGTSIVVFQDGSTGPPQQLLVHGETGPAASHERLDRQAAEAAVTQALAFWSHEIGTDQLRGIQIGVADLPQGTLGWAYGNSITLDVNADGAGWSTAGSSSGYDLLTVAAHEIGHVLGFDHSHDKTNLMASTLALGTRRLPGLLSVHAGDTRITDMAFVPSQIGGVLQSLWEGSDVELNSLDEDIVLVRRQDGSATLALDSSRTVPKSSSDHIAAVVDRDEDVFDVGGGVLDDSVLELLADDLASIDE